MEELMDWFAGEPTLEDTLADPIIRAVMKRDDIEVESLRRFLKDVSGRLQVQPNRCRLGREPRQAA
jgi:hypothetical protein